MEKLQEALKRAREERQATSRDAGTAPPPPPPAAEDAAPAPGLWSRLTLFTPDEDQLMRHHVVTNKTRAEATPFDILRTKILLIMRENGWRRLAITSPDQGSGKTTVTCNLALGLSRQDELKSILLDFDMRRPGIAAMLGCPSNSKGTAELLTGAATAEEVMVRVRDNLAICPSVGKVDDPTRILLASQTARMLDALQDSLEPDLMLFDLSPMLVTDDARLVLRHVDCALIVTRSERTRMSQIDTCEREVAECTNVLGMVLNSCRFSTDGDDYYY